MAGLMSKRTEAHREGDSRYNKKRDVKRVSFNATNAQDVERLRKLKAIPDFTKWVKSKIDELS
jgi:hypothetical protein